MEKGHFTILWSCCRFTTLQYLSHCVFLISPYHLNCTSMGDTAITTTPDCSVQSCRSWCLTTSAKSSAVYVPLPSDWQAFIRIPVLMLQKAQRWKAINIILRCFPAWRSCRHTIKKSCKQKEIFWNFICSWERKQPFLLKSLFHKEPSLSKLPPWMLLCGSFSVGLNEKYATEYLWPLFSSWKRL